MIGRLAQNQVNSAAKSKFSGLLKKFCGRFCSFIGFVCVPITFYDLIGYPAIVFGSSMEVIMGYTKI